MDRSKHHIPEAFENPEQLQEIRSLFKTPVVTPGDKVEFSFTSPDRDALVDFLVKEKQFNPERVNKVVDRLVKVKRFFVFLFL